MRIATFAVLFAACTGLVSCGETTGTRAVTGGFWVRAPGPACRP